MPSLFTTPTLLNSEKFLLELNRFLALKNYSEHTKLVALLNHIKANGKIEVNEIFKLQRFTFQSTLAFSLITLIVGFSLGYCTSAITNDIDAEDDPYFALIKFTTILLLAPPTVYIAVQPHTQPIDVLKVTLKPVLKEMNVTVNLDDLYMYLNDEKNGADLQNLLNQSNPNISLV